MNIKMFDKLDRQVRRAKNLVQETSVASWVVLFEGDRWRHVDRVAIAFGDGAPVGLASLAKTDEEGTLGSAPEIIGLWVHPSFRKQGIGAALIKACAQEADQCYGRCPAIKPATKAGVASARKASESVAIHVVNAGGVFGELP